MNLIKDNIMNIITVWVPAFLLFGQSAVLFLKSIGLKGDLGSVKDVFDKLDIETVRSIKALEKVPETVGYVLDKFNSNFEKTGKDIEKFMNEMLESIRKDINSVEARIEGRINTIEGRQHEQIVKIRRQVNRSETEGEDHVSEI